jgi:hypothetical protein
MEKKLEKREEIGMVTKNEVKKPKDRTKNYVKRRYMNKLAELR